MRNLMFKPLSLCALVVACVLTCSAQNNQKTNVGKAKPDLSGTWLLDASKGNSGKYLSSSEVKMKVVHSGPEIKMHRMINHNGRSTALEFTYFTDGRGESNQTTMFMTANPGNANPPGPQDLTKSKTGWSGNKVVTRARIRNMVAGHVIEYEVVDEWKLSDDGKTLTQTTRLIHQPDPYGGSVFIPARSPDRKHVYNRISD